MITAGESHAGPIPSAWVMRWLPQWQAGANALDLACGTGRHVRALVQSGLAVCALDRNADALASLAGIAETVQADLELGHWPLGERRFDVVLVTNYLWRPLLPRIRAAVAPGGWLVYETFGVGQETLGRPRNPEHLLQPGELLTFAQDFRVVAYEEGREMHGEGARVMQRIAARCPLEDTHGFRGPESDIR